MNENFVFIHSHLQIMQLCQLHDLQVSTRRKAPCPFGFAQGLEHCRNGSRLALSGSLSSGRRTSAELSRSLEARLP